MSNPQPPANSPLAELMLSEDRLLQLTSDSAIDQVETQYNEFLQLLWHLIDVAPDSSPYVLTWNIANLYAKADLLDFVQGNPDALARMLLIELDRY